MRVSRFLSLLSAGLLLPSVASAHPEQQDSTEVVAKSPEEGAKPVDNDSSPPTTFNGVKVPPMRELSGETMDQDIKTGHWLVEFFSPFCVHCKAMAPTWQTLYEFYYTSKPIAGTTPPPSDSQSSLNAFTRYYDFKFAKLDCVAFGTACSKHEVKSFPTIILFKDGKEVKRSVGGQDLQYMSKWVEEALESIKPGSRPKEGVKLPKVGAHSTDDAEAESKNSNPSNEKPADHSAAASEAANAQSENSSSQPASETSKKPMGTQNPDGVSIPLSAEKFQRLVTTTLDPWFIKFYAPWCHHCQAMAPNWAQMAKDMKGKLNIGEVNCDIESRLCKDASVKGYPTLLFFRGGERVEYDGLRGVGDLITYANKALDVGFGVVDVDATAFSKLEETEEVIFLYFYDHATTSEDFQALERLTLSLVGRAKLVKTKDPALAERFKISTWPRLLVSRNGKPTYYPPLSPREMRDFRAVLAWMKSVWLPIVPELTASNAKEIMNGKIVVLGILSRGHPDKFDSSKDEIKNAALEWIDRQTHAFQLERQELRDAKQLRIEEAEDRNDQRALRAAKTIRIDMDQIERKQVGFAWVDGIFWERWIRTTFGIDVRNGERVVINDEDNRRYWDETFTGNPIVPSRTSILETLPKVIASPPKLSPKSSTTSIERAIFTIKNAFSEHLWLSSGVAVVVLLVVFWTRGRLRKGKANGGGYFQLSEKDGLLGTGNAGGKVD